MGTRALRIVCFRGRYYIRYCQLDGYYEGLGADIVRRIPASPDKYQKWLESMRARYAANEAVVERAHETCGGSEPCGPNSPCHELAWFPTMLPRLDDWGAEYFYVINLDNEVLTMNFTIHWKLGNIPRQDDLWLRAIRDSIYLDEPTISLDLCPQEHMASPALVLPEAKQEIDYPFDTVTPRMDLKGAPNVFTARLLAGVILEYRKEIVRFGREWTPDSFPFRELTFALVSIASGQAKLHSFPTRRCHPQRCCIGNCAVAHVSETGWLGQEWAGHEAPLVEFGTMAHRPGEPPGASPTATRYWLQGVLVSLVLVVDGQALTGAVDWGLKQGRTDFQIVAMSLFEVSFAEVLSSGHLVKVSHAVSLSPIRAKQCLSTHPRERPELKPGTETEPAHGKRLMRSDYTGTAWRLQSRFPGLAALVNFFDVAASRRTATKPGGRLPPELYCRVLDFVDYDTWRACSTVSPEFRSYCLCKYRVDDHMRIVAGPFVRQRCYGYGSETERLLSFSFENLHTGKLLPMMEARGLCRQDGCHWMPIIGSDRRALMTNVVVQFAISEDVPVETASDDETAGEEN